MKDKTELMAKLNNWFAKQEKLKETQDKKEDVIQSLWLF